MQFFNLKRIAVEDFPKDQQDGFAKWGSIWNSFVDNFSQFIDKGVGYDNLNQELKTFSFTTTADGQPQGGLKFKTALNGNINGLIIASITLTTVTSFVTTMPVITFSQDTGLITITNIAGLTGNTKYNMTLLVI